MPRILLGLCATAAIGALVLYVITAHRVHETPALAGLQMVPTPNPVPAAATVIADGKALSLAAFKGRPVIVNLWATWCAPCVRELPALAHLAAASGIKVIAVNEGHDDAAKTAAFLKAHGAGNLTPYRDPHLVLLETFGAQGLPFSVIINAQGCLSARASGPLDWDAPKAIAYFKAL